MDTVAKLKQQRLYELDFLKAVAILMVVVGHTPCPSCLGHMVYYIHIPLFFLISGYTNKPAQYYSQRSNVIEFILKRIKSLYIPFLMFTIPLVLLHNLFFNIGIYDEGYSIGGLAKQIARTLAMSVGTHEPLMPQLWYIKTLFICEIMYAVILYVLQKTRISKWISLFPIALVCLWLDSTIFQDAIRTTIIWPASAIVFYMLGGAIRQLDVVSYRRIWIVIPIWFVAWIYCSKIHPLSFQNATGIWSIVITTGSIGGFLSLWYIASFLKRATTCQAFFSYIGKNTLPIYFWHYFFFAVITFLVQRVLNFRTVEGRFVAEIDWWLYVVLSTSFCLLSAEVYGRCKKKLLSLMRNS